MTWVFFIVLCDSSSHSTHKLIRYEHPPTHTTSSHSNWGGWHHVEVHDDNWWIVRMEAAGFLYSDILTQEMRIKAGEDKMRTDLVAAMEEGKQYSVAQHLWTTMLVSIVSNPLLPFVPSLVDWHVVTRTNRYSLILLLQHCRASSYLSILLYYCFLHIIWQICYFVLSEHQHLFAEVSLMQPKPWNIWSRPLTGN